MTLSKLQFAGGPELDGQGGCLATHEHGRATTLLYSGVVLGVLAGAAISTYLWRQRVRALNLLNSSPLDRAESLIESCESKLEDLERAFEEMKAAR